MRAEKNGYDNHLHFANTTNNRLECHNHKLKDVVSQAMSLSDMFMNVLLFCRTNAEEYTHKVFIEEFSTRSTVDDSIADVSMINTTCTAYSADRIVTVSSGDSNGDFIAVYKSGEHHVSLIDNNCSCSFSKVMGIPCWHIFVVRASQNLPVFEVQLVARRWHKDYQLLCELLDDCHEEGKSDAIQVPAIDTSVPLHSTLSKNHKYKKVLGLGQKLAALSSECGMVEFRRKADILESLLKYWERNCDIEYFLFKRLMMKLWL